jgi:hypothetical protein
MPFITDEELLSSDLAEQGSCETTRQDLLRFMQGQRMVIPDLESLMSHWPQGVNSEMNRLQKDVDCMLEEYQSIQT